LKNLECSSRKEQQEKEQRVKEQQEKELRVSTGPHNQSFPVFVNDFWLKFWVKEIAPL